MNYGNEFSQEAYLKGEGGIQVIDVLEAFGLNQHRAHAVEYLLRAGKKLDTIQDLRKAIWWIEREISYLERMKGGGSLKPVY